MAVQAAIALNNDKAYLFTPNDSYDRFNSTTGAFEESKDVATNWSGLPGSPWAALYWGFGKAFFFIETQYYRYDLGADRVDDGYPLTITDHWPGVWPTVDAAINWGNGKIYFFRGSEYIRYDIALDRTDAGYPKPIADGWLGIWDDRIDAIIYQGGQKAYFFHDRDWREYDADTDAVTASGDLDNLRFAPVPPGALNPARLLSDSQANGLLADLVRRGQLSLQGGTVPGAGQRLRITPTTIGGINYANKIAPSATVIDNVDQKMAIALHRLTRWLNSSAPTIIDILHLGIGHGGGPPNDCHNQGRALDFAGINGTVDDTPFTRGVASHWGSLPGSGVRIGSADDLTQLLFRTAYTFGSFECESDGIGSANRYPPPDIGGSGFVIYPDYGGDASLRAAHQDHIHMQVGPTRI